MNAGPIALPSVSVLIAAYNEEATVAEVLRNVAETLPGAEIVVVDDGSQDATIAEVERARTDIGTNVKLLRHAVNRGKGAAVRTAIGASTGDVVVIQDADLEYDPRDIPKLLAPIVEGPPRVVYRSPPRT